MNKINFISMGNFVSPQIILSLPIKFISKIKNLIVTKHNSCHNIVFQRRQCKSLIIYGLLWQTNATIDIVSITLTHEMFKKKWTLPNITDLKSIIPIFFSVTHYLSVSCLFFIFSSLILLHVYQVGLLFKFFQIWY